MQVKNIVIGAGITGITLAERLSAQGEEVLLIEKRNHIGGNCYDCYNEEGIFIQKYGLHIFHTSINEVWEYLSKFTEWIDYKHRVVAKYKEKIYPLPINLTTINQFFGTNLNSEEVEGFLESKKIKIKEINNSEEVVISKVGTELYDAFIKDYTFKQWGLYPHQLDKEVLERLPVRMDNNDLYFSDTHQCIPKYGFTVMFNNMLKSSNIKIMLNTNYKEVLNEIKHERLFITSPIDEYFDFKFGKLPYRSIIFEFETINKEEYQPYVIVNYPEKEPAFTKLSEFKKMTGQKHPYTTICKEFPSGKGEPSYPIPTKDNKELLQQYLNEVKKLKNVYFAGRLGTYSYLNIDQACNSALMLMRKIKNKPE